MDIGTSNLLGIGLNQLGNSMQMGQQQSLMQQQMANQMALNNQNAQIQRDNWDYTNYENQVKHMQKAGLNVGLMYGMGGGGGSSMGSGGGGSAAGGQAPQNNMAQIMGIMQQSKVAESQANLNDAQANKLKSETPTSGNLGESALAGQSAETNKKLMETESIKLDNAFKSGNINTALEQAETILTQEKLKNDNLVQQNKIDSAEAKNREQLLKLEIIGKGLENKLTKAQTDGSIQMTEESKQRILQKWKELEIQNKGLDQNQIKNNIEKFKADTTREYPAVWSVMGKTMDIMVRGLDEWSEKQLGKPREYK